jgi:hypothetical protein
MMRLTSVLVLAIALLGLGCSTTTTTTYRVSSAGQRRIDPQCNRNALRNQGEFCQTEEHETPAGTPRASSVIGVTAIGLGVLAIVALGSIDVSTDHSN